jgi:ATP-dependent Clp protease ATP-binding subunit ClpC
MFERFTEPARLVVVLAQEETRRLGHDHIGPEHLLLGVLRTDGAPRTLLEALGVDADRVRARVVDVVGERQLPGTGQIPFTPSAKKALELSLREALDLRVTFIGPEHILLGLVRDGESVATRVLDELGVDRRALTTLLRGIRPDPGELVEVALGRKLIGDLGNPRVDARLLLAMLEKDGAGAKLLREHGVDEDAVRRLLGP